MEVYLDEFALNDATNLMYLDENIEGVADCQIFARLQEITLGVTVLGSQGNCTKVDS